MLLVGLLLSLAMRVQAGEVTLAFEYELDLQSSVSFTLHVVGAHGGQAAAQDLPVALLPRCPTTATFTPLVETVCVQLCLEPDDYSLTAQAHRGVEASPFSNILDVDLRVTTPCTLPLPPPPPDKKRHAFPIPPPPLPIPVATDTVLADLPNPGCVTWKITGACFCNPFTPCVSVSYYEPAYLVEVVKQPGTTLLTLGQPLLAAALKAAGLSLWGGGGAANATGDGQTNKHYAEAHVWQFPQLLGGPCTGCAPSGTFTLHYASELDLPTWRTATAAPTPLDLVQQIGVWARLYPRGGTVIHSSEVIASAVTAIRAMDITRQPIGTPPNVDVHRILQPIPDDHTCAQMALPKRLPCMTPGTPPPLWETGTTSKQGNYLLVFWRQRTCCVEPARATCGITVPGVGGQGANLCLLPPLPTP